MPYPIKDFGKEKRSEKSEGTPLDNFSVFVQECPFMYGKKEAVGRESEGKKVKV